MTPDDLRAWQHSQGYTYDTASKALGMSRAQYANLLAGISKIDQRTALACGALAAGIEPWPASQPNRHPLAKTQPPLQP
jgi:hypothetical protein